MTDPVEVSLLIVVFGISNGDLRLYGERGLGIDELCSR